MKKAMLSLFCAIMFTALTSAASAAPVATVPAPATWKPDLRDITQAHGQHRPTVYYWGDIHFKATALDGSSKYVHCSYRSRFIGRQLMVGYFAVESDVIWDESLGHAPRKQIPYYTAGTASDLRVYISGFDQNGYCTRYGTYFSKAWLPNDPFVFAVDPGSLPVVKKLDLAGRDPSNVVAQIEGWGGYNDYNKELGGFLVWVNPLQDYRIQVVDRSTGGVILPWVSFHYSQDPKPDPVDPGSCVSVDLGRGAHEVHFDKDGFYNPITGLNFTGQMKNSSGISMPATSFLIYEDELGGEMASISVDNRFGGEIIVEGLFFQKTVTPGADSLYGEKFKQISRQTVTPGSEWHYVEVPAGLARVAIYLILGPQDATPGAQQIVIGRPVPPTPPDGGVIVPKG